MEVLLNFGLGGGLLPFVATFPVEPSMSVHKAISKAVIDLQHARQRTANAMDLVISPSNRAECYVIKSVVGKSANHSHVWFISVLNSSREVCMCIVSFQSC